MKQLYGLGAVDHNRLRWAAVVILPLWALFCMGWLTQTLAAFFRYHSALGAPVFGQWYLPWQCIFWLQSMDTSVVEGPLKNALLLFSAPMALFLFIALYFKGLKGREDLHGTARWARKEDIEKAGLLEEEGVYVGGWKNKDTLHYLVHNGPEHILAFAPTRSGKGVGLVLPTLLSWGGSSLTLDIKGENWALSSGYRKSLGHKVLRFEPTEIEGHSARFNPLAEVRLASLSAIADVQNICDMIVDPNGKGIGDHWTKSAFAFLSGILLHTLVVCREQGRIANFSDAVGTVTDPRWKEDIKELFDYILTIDHEAVLAKVLTAKDQGAFEAIKNAIHSSAVEMMAKPDRELGSVISTAMSNLSIYRDPVVAANVSTSDFRIHDLMNYEVPVDLYLIVRPSDIGRLRPVLRLLMNIILRRLTEKMEFRDGRAVAHYNHRLLLMMDEFPALGRMEVMQQALAFMAGYGVKSYLIVQDLTQLQEAYSKEEAITSNCHIKIAYAANKVETARYLSEMTGKTTVVQHKRSRSGKHSGFKSNESVSVSEVARPLLTPDECTRLPGPKKNAKGEIVEPGDMLIFPAGGHCIYGKQMLYFRDPVLSARSKIASPVGSDRLGSAAALSDSKKIDVAAMLKEVSHA